MGWKQKGTVTPWMLVSPESTHSWQAHCDDLQPHKNRLRKRPALPCESHSRQKGHANLPRLFLKVLRFSVGSLTFFLNYCWKNMVNNMYIMPQLAGLCRPFKWRRVSESKTAVGTRCVVHSVWAGGWFVWRLCNSILCIALECSVWQVLENGTHHWFTTVSEIAMTNSIINTRERKSLNWLWQPPESQLNLTTTTIDFCKPQLTWYHLNLFGEHPNDNIDNYIQLIDEESRWHSERAALT